MGRPSAFDREEIVRAARELVAEGGLRSATVAAIAARLGAPTGSIYHRFESRELLLAELWLTTVSGFQRGLLAALEGPDPVRAGVEAALFSPRWVARYPTEARLLLLHRREDFMHGPWPRALKAGAERLGTELASGLQTFARRCCGSADKEALRRVRFAVLGISYGAVKGYVEAGRAPPAELEELIEAAVLAVLRRGGHKRRKG
ncbi:MAG: TetR/AcrR family transcriptional regulator [Myxococcaceae bacterium]